MWPGSGRAEAGVTYAYDVSHCGLAHDLDFDGSFWEPFDPPPRELEDDLALNPDQGSITLVTEGEALFESSDGETVRVRRIEGPVVQRGCG